MFVEKDKLIQYLKTIERLEKDKRTLYYSIYEKDRDIRQLGNCRIISPPDKPFIQFDIDGATLFEGLLFSLAIGVILFTFFWSIFHPESIDSPGIGGLIFSLCIIAVGLYCVVGMLRMLIGPFFDYYSDIQKYKNELVAHQQQLQQDQIRVQQELILKEQVSEDRQILSQQWEQADKTLQSYYDLNVIYPSYRAIVPVSMFIQYLESGRCSQLEGSDGCYNLYESELRQNVIISKLDIIIEKLEEIKNSQYELQQTILESNREISQLCDRQIDIQQQHARVAEYQRQQIIDNQRIMGEYMIYRDLITS